MCSGDHWCPCCEDWTAGCDDPVNCDEEEALCYECEQGFCDHVGDPDDYDDEYTPPSPSASRQERGGSEGSAT